MAHPLPRAIALLLALAACGDSNAGAPTAPRPSAIMRIAVSPASQVSVIGTQLKLSATAYDAAGDVVPDVEFQWSSSNTEVAVVDGTGSVLTRGLGWVGIKASAPGAAGTALLAVELR